LLARAGTQECIAKGILNQYPVLTEKPGEYVAQFQWTVLISGKRIIPFAMMDMTEQDLQSEGAVTNEQLKKLIETPLVEFTSKPKPAPKKK
jgi:hypothetical protein